MALNQFEFKQNAYLIAKGFNPCDQDLKWCNVSNLKVTSIHQCKHYSVMVCFLFICLGADMILTVIWLGLTLWWINISSDWFFKPLQDKAPIDLLHGQLLETFMQNVYMTEKRFFYIYLDICGWLFNKYAFSFSCFLSVQMLTF